MKGSSYTVSISLVVALGGFLLGFDSAVISGVVEPIRAEFGLTDLWLGWSVSCLIFGAMAGNALAGPMADRFGRKSVLIVTAVVFAASALATALAQDFWLFIAARILGGLGVGGAILIAPIYIAEIAPPERRGQLVSFNQLNIVVGISAAFFSNYFMNEAGLSWRWMVGIEAVPAVLYFAFLFFVPRSPRWLAAKGRDAEALQVLESVGGPEFAKSSLAAIKEHLHSASGKNESQAGMLLTRRLRFIMTVAFALAFFQQITGINAIFYYAPTIFVKAGAGADSALLQAVIIGLVNLGFTLVAMKLIDRLGRRPLLLIGTAAMSAALFTNAAAFATAKYELNEEALATAELPSAGNDALSPLIGTSYASQAELVSALKEPIVRLEAEIGKERTDELVAAVDEKVEAIAKSGLVINGTLVLIAIMTYIAAFAISLGPVMWAMLSEIFPNQLRGVAISVVGFFNSLVSFSVTFLFPWELTNLGPALTFAIFGGFAALAFIFTLTVVPETKGKTLEELESLLMRP